ncbi:hypothetical protein J6590_019046 [Homalodisca vitripennis]|nr:hypothetical protein J6590_019046 [Homalodisca vitripennis]
MLLPVHCDPGYITTHHDVYLSNTSQTRGTAVPGVVRWNRVQGMIAFYDRIDYRSGSECPLVHAVLDATVVVGGYGIGSPNRLIGHGARVQFLSD